MSKNKYQQQINPLANIGEQIATAREAETTTKSRKINRGELKKTTFQLYEDQRQWLGRVCLETPKNNGISISRSVLLRQLMDFAKEYDLDLKGIQSEEEVSERLRAAVLKANK